MVPAALLVICWFDADHVWLVVTAAAGAAGGLYLCFNGFGRLQFKRMILNTPLSRIRSASIGLLEITGTPVGPNILSAPITGQACYYYRVRVWQWHDNGKNHEWKSVLEESLCVPFFLEDSTGRVLVDPQGAEMDVHKSFSDELDASLFRIEGLWPPRVRDFLLTRGLLTGEKLKLEERIIPQDFPLFVFGTLGENPSLPTSLALPHSSNTSLELQSGSGSLFRVNFPGTGAVRNPSNRAFTALRNAVSGLPGVHLETGNIPLPPNRASGTAAGRAAQAAAVLSPAPAPHSPSPKSNFGEFEAHPHVAIGKGLHHAPFAISGLSQKELVGKLAWKSAALIWGGLALTLPCLYFLICYFERVP